MIIFPHLPDAACIGTDTESFFVEGYDTSGLKAARRICENCPELERCRDYAIRNDDGYGLWGGLMPKERQQMRVRMNVINNKPSSVIDNLVGYRERSK